jgi:TRAP transporter TatT component family protein
LRVDNYKPLYLLCLFFLFCSGCASTVTKSFSHNISQAILEQNDPETVREGAPAFLLLLDGFISQDPNNREQIRAAADLYSVYATIFVDDKERSKILTEKALNYARTAICIKTPAICNEEIKDIEEFTNILNSLDKTELPYLYSLGAAWASRIEMHSDDWNAVANLPRIQAIMQRVINLDENYSWGRAHLYMAVLNSQFSTALGGKPEIGRMHFEKAIELSSGKDLIAKVEFAKRYARLMFDKELHDRLIKEVLDADPVSKRLTLSNTIAQQKARQLQKTSAEYFEE